MKKLLSVQIYVGDEGPSFDTLRNAGHQTPSLPV